ncbi:MAG: endonuclease [Brevundimonas sp.]|nr:endonuclease [Brevundimonas sp.]
MSEITVAHRRRWIAMIKDGERVVCGICGKQIFHTKKDPKGRLSVDHILPKSWGGSDDSRNLQPSHVGCNQKKGNKIDD